MDHIGNADTPATESTIMDMENSLSGLCTDKLRIVDLPHPEYSVWRHSSEMQDDHITEHVYYVRYIGTPTGAA